MNTEKKHVLFYKLLFTALILFIYLLGRCLPLYGINTAAYIGKGNSAENLLMQTVTGDRYRYSILALGISPYMISSLIVQIFMSLRNTEKKSKVSPKKMNRFIMISTLLIAFVQALNNVNNLIFLPVYKDMIFVRIVACLEMITGAFLIVWLSVRNKKYGIGGQTALIFVNIVDGLISTVHGHGTKEMLIPTVVSAIVMVIVIVMENTERRIPVQRISIHNIYADKNYLAIKLNPIGVMPVMFSTAFFMLPQLIVGIAADLFTNNMTLAWCRDNMKLDRPLGIGVYIAVLFVLTIGFSVVFISPRDITDQFLKSGDSILNLHAGKDTKRFLSTQIILIGFVSACVMSLCLGVPLYLQMSGEIENTLTMLPSSVMILTGIWCNLYQEIVAVKRYDAYKPFI